MSLVENSEADSVAARLDAAIESALAERRIVGGVVLVARNGELAYRRAAGLADRESARPMREDAIFRLASVTKPLVSAALMSLVEAHRLDLADPVTRWLPDFRPALADGSRPAITLHQLLTHTSGLGYRFSEPEGSAYHALDISDGLDQPGLSLEENLRRLVDAPLAFAPGTAWRYSLGLDVIGAVLERAEGRPLPQVVREHVTGPLGLVDTDFAVVDQSRLVTPYAAARPEPQPMSDGMAVPLWEGAVRFAPSRILDPTSYPSGGTGMAGTAGDILRFLEALRGGGSPILTGSSVAVMMAPQAGHVAQGPGWEFGYGGSVLVDPALAATPQSKGTMVWGGVYGHSWFVDPAEKLTVVILTNTAYEGMIGQLTTDIRDAVYG